MKNLFKMIIFTATLAISTARAQTSNDTTLDLNKHPELVQAILKNPENWPVLLRAHDRNNADPELSKKRQVIRDIIAYLVRENVVKDREGISSFLLTETTMTVNGKDLPDAQQQFLKDRYIPEPGYVVYFGNSEQVRNKHKNGIFQRTDNL